MTTALPRDTKNQTFVSVQALIVGRIFLPYRQVFQDCVNRPETHGSCIPVFTFLITHPTRGKVLFDLGIKKHAKGYPPAVESTFDVLQATCEEDVVEQLERGGTKPDDIATVIYSHLHWDHVGDLTSFKSAELILGSDGKSLLTDAYPKSQDSCFLALPADQQVTFIDFEQDPRKVSPFATFDRAIDLYGDGSLYLVDTPGHLPGHISTVARLAPDTFAFLAADTCHNRECYAPGERLVSQELYVDLEVARATVRKLTKLHLDMDNVVVVLAHEREREYEMPFFPEDLREWVVAEVAKRAETRALHV